MAAAAAESGWSPASRSHTSHTSHSSHPFRQLTNDKFSMTNSQFTLTLVPLPSRPVVFHLCDLCVTLWQVPLWLPPAIFGIYAFFCGKSTPGVKPSQTQSKCFSTLTMTKLRYFATMPPRDPFAPPGHSIQVRPFYPLAFSLQPFHLIPPVST
jgi:hypothetical protein